jgi:hypothetical protein
MPVPVPRPSTVNGRRRLKAIAVLTTAILDGMDDDTLVLGVTVTTTSRTGEYVQHSCGMRSPDVHRMMIPPHLRGELDELAAKLIDLADLPDVPDSPGWLP